MKPIVALSDNVLQYIYSTVLLGLPVMAASVGHCKK